MGCLPSTNVCNISSIHSLGLFGNGVYPKLLFCFGENDDHLIIHWVWEMPYSQTNPHDMNIHKSQHVPAILVWTECHQGFDIHRWSTAIEDIKAYRENTILMCEC